MILVQNVYYMLSYAFRVLKKQGYNDIATETFENSRELFAEIMIRGVKHCVKGGLKKEYISKKEPLNCLRGKIDTTASLKERTLLRQQLVCDFDEFSLNSYMNRIIRVTMEYLVDSDISKERKKQLKKLLIYFSSVESIDIKNIDWHLNFNRNNQEYRMLIGVCYLTLKGLLQTPKNGKTKLEKFLDDQKMYHLYERFLLEYYRQEHPELKVSSSQIKWDIESENTDLLPIMISDVMLQKGDKTLIIDAKCYSNMIQQKYGHQTFISSNIYQIFTYTKNYDKQNTGNVSGMLLYAKTDNARDIKQVYKMGKNNIYVNTLDLNKDFKEIRKHLDGIVETVFSDI